MNSTLQRRSNGTYAPGVSGNPTGRPPGLSSFKTLADESQFSRRLFEILVAKCEEGDMQAIKIVADRLWPRPRPEISVAGGSPGVGAVWVPSAVPGTAAVRP